MFKQSARSVIARLPARVSTVTRISSRRWASSSSGHSAPASNDMLWAAGSAVVFGGAGAYLLTGSAHHEAVAHGTTHMKELTAEREEEQASSDDAPKDEEEEKTADAPSEDEENAPSESKLKESLNQAEAAAVPKAAMSSEQSPSEDNSEEKESTKDEQPASSNTDDEGDEPSPEAIQASLHQAETAAVPRASMTGEDAGEK